MTKVIKAMMIDDHPVCIPSSQNLHPVWKSQVQLSDGSISSAHFKFVAQEEMFTEAVCAILGRHLGLHVPQPMFIFVPKGNVSNEDTIAFGMESLNCRDVRQLVNDDQSFMQTLKAWADLPSLACFDEFIANWDRHGGNLMYDGTTFYPIDHGLSFDKAANKTNIMGNVVVENDQLRKQRMYNMARDKQPDYCGTPYKQWLQEMDAPVAFTDFAVRFLSGRVGEVEDLLRHRYGNPRLVTR